MTRRVRASAVTAGGHPLEAELRSALAREGVQDDAGSLLSGMTWVHPGRQLTPEFDRVLAAGYLKGADLWHLATAAFLAPEGRDLVFLSPDRRQREVAARLGFTVSPRSA